MAKASLYAFGSCEECVDKGAACRKTSPKVKLPMISARMLEPPVEALKCSEFAEAIIKQFK